MYMLQRKTWGFWVTVKGHRQPAGIRLPRTFVSAVDAAAWLAVEYGQDAVLKL